MSDTTTTSESWWRRAVIYQVYPRSFADASGDGVGDLRGITAHLDHLHTLGVDAVWLSPFYRSPQRDGGYDVADFCDVDPLFGTLSDFDELLAGAHARGLRVIVDIVPNHSSSDHRWFQEALAAGPGSPERDRYIFRAGRGIDGAEPPNNWLSMFGGPAWTRVTEADGTPGQWYLHLFDSTQPDLNWANPWVADRFDEILRFWFDRGVDGFRIDVAHGLAKHPDLPDVDVEPGRHGGEWAQPGHPYWSRDEVHAIWRRWRSVAQTYPGERILVAEAWVATLDLMAQWVRPDELHQAFNFAYLMAPWDARDLRATIDESLSAFSAVGAPSTWVLSNHDTVRHTTRLALRTPVPHGIGIGPSSAEHPDEDLGLHRGRAATVLMLALPGSAYIYQGEELGLPEAMDIPDEARQDPTWLRTPPDTYGRDGCRVPLPWENATPAYGFSPTGESWLPQPDSWARYAASVQEGDPTSTLALYRTVIGLRREHDLGSATLTWNEAASGVLDFQVGDVRVVANLSGAGVTVPAREVLVTSGEIGHGDNAITLPADTTVWLRA